MAGLNVARQFRYLQTQGKVWIFSRETLLVMVTVALSGFVLMPRFLLYELAFAGLIGAGLTYAEHRVGQSGVLVRYLRFWFRADHHHPGTATPEKNYRPRVYAPWRFTDRGLG